MRVIEISNPGGPDVLKLTERAIPTATKDEVLIKVTAAGVNRPDILQRMGLYPPPPGASDLPGLEVSGEIAACGDEVTDLAVGDRVCALLPAGGYAEYAIADAGSCLPIPSGITMTEAATLPETFFTVYANVIDDAQLKAGETFLVHGATSGIGVCAIMMAKAIGARVIATASSRHKCDAASNLGADMVFRYDEDSWEREIQSSGCLLYTSPSPRDS